MEKQKLKTGKNKRLQAADCGLYDPDCRMTRAGQRRTRAGHVLYCQYLPAADAFLPLRDGELPVNEMGFPPVPQSLLFRACITASLLSFYFLYPWLPVHRVLSKSYITPWQAHDVTRLDRETFCPVPSCFCGDCRRMGSRISFSLLLFTVCRAGSSKEAFALL